MSGRQFKLKTVEHCPHFFLTRSPSRVTLTTCSQSNDTFSLECAMYTVSIFFFCSLPDKMFDRYLHSNLSEFIYLSESK
jgi:hypothetical protein